MEGRWAGFDLGTGEEKVSIRSVGAMNFIPPTGFWPLPIVRDSFKDFAETLNTLFCFV